LDAFLLLPKSVKALKEYKLFFLHFNVHFTGRPGLAGSRMSPFWILLELRVMVMVVTAGAVRRAKLQSLIPETNQHPSFYSPDALPATQQAV